MNVYGGLYDIDAVKIILDKYLKEEPFSMEIFIHPKFII
jgi:hypothetical protein